MRTLICSLILVICIADGVRSATKLDFRTVDELTYRYFTEQKWDSVIRIGKKAIRQDIDYYYLRVRMGISYFEKRAYLPAITHLEKAREFNSGDPVITDYLYRSYLNSNRYAEAQLLKTSLRNDNKETGNSVSGILEQVHFEGGYFLSSDRSPKNLSDLMGKDSLYGEQDLYGNSLYGSLGLKLRVSKRIGLSFAYNYLNFTKTKYIRYGRAEDHLVSITDTSWGRNYNYTFPWVIYDTGFRYHVSQHEAYIDATITLPWGIKVMPAFHWIYVSYTMTNSSFRMDTVQDTAFYVSFNNTYNIFKFPRTIYSFDRKDTAFNNYVVALRISKDIGRFSIALSGSWSNLNNLTQEQAGIMLTYYPLGNLNLYGTSAVTRFFQGKENRWLLSEVMGVKVTPWCWLEGNIYWGDYNNANIFNGLIVYNNGDKMDYRTGTTLAFLVGKHFQLSLNYQYFSKESQQLYYIKITDPVTHEINEKPQIKNNPYYTNNIIGGITWKL